VPHRREFEQELATRFAQAAPGCRWIQSVDWGRAYAAFESGRGGSVTRTITVTLPTAEIDRGIIIPSVSLVISSFFESDPRPAL